MQGLKNLQEGKKFVRLPQEELGIFYTMDCYVFLCRYEVLPEEDESDVEEEQGSEIENEGNDEEKVDAKKVCHLSLIVLKHHLL